LSLTSTNNVNATILPWHILFWSTFVLAWFILPLVREMLLSGHFTTRKRLKDGMRKMLTGQLILLLFVVIFIIAMAIYLHSIHVKPVLITLGNTYGLLIVSLLLGYGLVALPRSLWRQAEPAAELRRAQIMAGAVDEALFEAVWELQDCEYAIDCALAKIADSKLLSDIYYKYCVDDLLRRKREAGIMSPELDSRRTENRNRVGLAGNRSDVTEDDNGTPTLEKLVDLNLRLMCTQEKLLSAELQWEALIKRCKFLVDISMGSTPPSSLSRIESDFLYMTDSRIRALRWKLRSIWMKYLRSLAFRLLAILAACLSTAILWSEATLALTTSLSPFSFFLGLFDNGGERGFLFQIAALIPLVYMSICVYSSLFKLSAFGPFCLRGNMQSSGVALAFNAQLLVRLQFPLGYNFLLMLKYDASSLSAFQDFMGVMSVVPLFGQAFSVYAPLLIIALCIVTLFNIYPRLLSLLGVQHEDAVLVGDSETMDAKVNEGITLLRKHVEGMESAAGQRVVQSSMV